MAALNSLISDIINGRDICTFCYKLIEGDALDIEDEVILKNDLESSVLFTHIISSLMGLTEQYALITTKICESCARSAIISYTFIEMCNKSRNLLTETVEELSHCIIDPEIDKEKFKSLYLTTNSKPYKKYYDKYCTVNSPGKALKRFKVLSKRGVSRKRLLIMGTSVNQASEHSLDDAPFDNNIESDVDDKIIICEACPRTFPNSKQSRAHFVRVHAPKNFKCNECPRTFGAAYLLKLHKSESHISAMCAQCGKTYNNIHSLKMHSFSHAKLSCPICERQYKTRNSYRKHVKSKMCSKQKGIKRMNVVKNYTCDICSKSFAHKGTLQVHISFEHENGKSYSCSWCNKKFPAQSRLKSHIVKHTKERNFTCEVCGGKFVTKEALLYHTRIHTGEKPYDCPHCDMKFLSASRRMDHVRRKHMGPTLECNVCNSKFRTPCSLRKHKRRHFNPNSRLFTQNIPESVEV